MALKPSEAKYDQDHIADNATTSIILANVICSAVAGIAVFSRLVSRRLRRLSLQTDDYLALIAMVFAIGFLANTLFGLRMGLGKHIILSKNPVAFAKSTIAAEVIYATGVVPVKLSLMFLYRRIFPNRTLHVALWIVGAVVVCMGIAADLLAIFSCVPVKASWDPTIASRCINFNTWITFHGAQNIVTDFVLLVLPMPLVWRLKMATIHKTQVSGIFVLGGFASVASIIRLTYLSNVSLIDATWADVGGNIWSMVELCMGITSACLPTLGPVVSYIIHGPSGTRGSSGRLNVSDQEIPRSGRKKKLSSNISWPGLRTTNSTSGQGGNSFSRLRNSQEDTERNWPVVAPFAQAHHGNNRGVKMSAMRSSDGGDVDQPLNGIKVTTNIEQDASDLRKF